MHRWFKVLLGCYLLLPSLVSSSPITTSIVASPNLKLIGVHDFYPAQDSHVLKASGAQVVRLPITWHLFEARGPRLTDAWFWDALDKNINAIEASGAQVIIQMAQTPCWASSAPDKHCQDANYTAYLKYPPTNPAHYGKALARLAARYKGRILAYEIWNEPNLTVNWPPYQPRAVLNDAYNSFIDLTTAAQYTALVKASYSRLKAADPNAFVLAGSIAGGDAAYVTALYQSGIKGYFDALSMHPYTDVAPNTGNMSYGPSECPATVIEPKIWCFKLGVERIKQAMLKAGDARKIWFTEFGFDSNTYWNGSGLVGQATHLAQAIKLIKSWDYVPVAAWYALVDNDSTLNQRESQFGLFTSNLAWKPSGKKFQTLLAQHAKTPIPLTPLSISIQRIPSFSWQAVPKAVSYRLWLNEYASPNVLGKINTLYTPLQSGCSKGGICTVKPNLRLGKVHAEWWVTAYDASGKAFVSVAAKFQIK